MKIVGLTGGIASGKSTVSKLLREHQIAVIDADEISKELTAPGNAGYKDIVKVFGDEILDTTQPKLGGYYPINRVKLGEIIFTDVEKRRALNKIMHGKVIFRIVMSILRCFLTGKSVVILDVPLLYETKLQKYCSKVVVVYTKQELQLERLTLRNPESAEQAKARINSQIDIEEKKKWADVVIDNNGSLDETKKQVDQLVVNELRGIPKVRSVVAGLIVLGLSYVTYRWVTMLQA